MTRFKLYFGTTEARETQIKVVSKLFQRYHSKMDFHRKNHYVPQTYLRRWALPTDENKVWEYRILVEHENIALWKVSSIRAIAYHSHLYTRIVAGVESDEIERWFDLEFETLVEDVLQKVTSDSRLTSSDWRILVRFLSAQDLRTPARLIESLQRWDKTLPEFIEKTVQNTIQNLESIRVRGEKMPDLPSPLMEVLPIRSKTEIKPDQKFGMLEVNLLVGRELWLSTIKHQLTKTAEVLHRHKWTILSPPKGMNWFTTDDPVTRLNYQSPQKYNFNGGWASPGTEIFMPLSPNHLLYTQVGVRPPERRTRVSLEQALIIRRCIAERAHRSIFALGQDTKVAELRPRTVNAGAVESEKAQWDNWNKDQIEAEQKFRAG